MKYMCSCVLRFSSPSLYKPHRQSNSIYLDDQLVILENPYHVSSTSIQLSFSFQRVLLFLKEQQEKNADWKEQGWRVFATRHAYQVQNTH